MRFVIVLMAAVIISGCRSHVSLPSYGVVPEFRLTDQSGRPFHSGERLNGNVWVANFIFTTCMGPCPRMTGQMRELRDAAYSAKDVRLVSFTIDPARDTPEVLATYGKRYGADPQRWYFLTGTQAALHDLKRNTFLLGDVDGSLEHSTRFVLIDRHSRIRGYYDSSDQEHMRKLEKDLQMLIRSDA